MKSGNRAFPQGNVGSRQSTWRVAALAAIAGCLSGAALAWADEPAASDTKPAASDAKPVAAAPKPREPLEARCTDGSLLKLTLLDAKIPVKTDYGVLEIAAADIQRIDFATRVPAATAERVKTAIANLGNSEFKVRDAAFSELVSLAEHAYRDLLVAVESSDPEVVMRADQLIERIRKDVPADRLLVQEYDVIHTAKSQFGGMIPLETLKVDTTMFGQQQIALSALRSLGNTEEYEIEPTNVLPDPGTMQNYQNQVGRTFFFRLSGPPPGVRNGMVWGSDIYTFDSMVSLAAVHAGVLKPGETRAVGVTMLGPQNAFAAVTRNGVASGNWGPYPSAYRFVPRKAARR